MVNLLDYAALSSGGTDWSPALEDAFTDSNYVEIPNEGTSYPFATGVTVPLGGEQPRRRVEADPTRARHVCFAPGVQIRKVRFRPGRPFERLLIHTHSNVFHQVDRARLRHRGRDRHFPEANQIGGQ